MDLASLVVGVIGMITITMKLIDFVKNVSNGTEEKRAILTQLAVWAVATAVVFLYSASDFGTFEIGGVFIDDMEWTTKLILGLAIGSAGGVAVDYRKAIDGSDSAKQAPLNI